jgi:ascorbate-specific PTS system EIIC-type component UlaA
MQKICDDKKIAINHNGNKYVIFLAFLFKVIIYNTSESADNIKYFPKIQPKKLKF